MRFAERLTAGHASENELLAVIAGEPRTPHVESCAACQARLTQLNGWLDDTAAEAAAAADEVFTPDVLAAQQAQILRRLEAAGRSARVIAFPLGSPAAAPRRTSDVLRWAAAAAIGGIMVGIASGRLLDSGPPAAFVSGVSNGAFATVPLSEVVSPETARLTGNLDEAALLVAAYERVSVDALEAMDEMTPRARDLARVSLPRSRR
ncbi:MAG: hypothetical protein M3R55_14360 [Acidobacteriota bacterium]|nr:hypothetical protein [Acidobacteriota bacterium]